jgi:peptide/nickel transport system permease protein
MKVSASPEPPATERGWFFGGDPARLAAQSVGPPSEEQERAPPRRSSAFAHVRRLGWCAFSRHRSDGLTGAGPSAGRAAWGSLRANPQVLFGATLLLAIVLLAVFADRLYPGDPLDTVAAPLIAPFTDPHDWLGTDSLGRDVAAGIVHGTRASLLIGATAALLGILIGTTIGALAGFFGGWVDALLVRITEIVQTTPAFLLVIVIVTIGQPTLAVISLAIGVASWPLVARLVRAEFRSLVKSEFVTAARSLGYGPVRIIFREILPNALPPIIVTASVMVATAILMESALAFLGQGDPNRISWGSMIGSGREMLRTAPSLTILPGAALVLTILSLNLLGDGLNRAFNPRLRERR